MFLQPWHGSHVMISARMQAAVNIYLQFTWHFPVDAVVSIERRQLEICELLFEIPLSADSNVSGCHTSNVFAAFVEYITKKNVGMLRNVQPAGMSGVAPERLAMVTRRMRLCHTAWQSLQCWF
jgi:hypothetical protein